jgi:hypothetical protein
VNLLPFEKAFVAGKLLLYTSPCEAVPWFNDTFSYPILNESENATGFIILIIPNPPKPPDIPNPPVLTEDLVLDVRVVDLLMVEVVDELPLAR